MQEPHATSLARHAPLNLHNDRGGTRGFHDFASASRPWLGRVITPRAPGTLHRPSSLQSSRGVLKVHSLSRGRGRGASRSRKVKSTPFALAPSSVAKKRDAGAPCRVVGLTTTSLSAQGAWWRAWFPRFRVGVTTLARPGHPTSRLGPRLVNPLGDPLKGSQTSLPVAWARSWDLGIAWFPPRPAPPHRRHGAPNPWKPRLPRRDPIFVTPFDAFASSPGSNCNKMF